MDNFSSARSCDEQHLLFICMDNQHMKKPFSPSTFITHTYNTHTFKAVTNWLSSLVWGKASAENFSFMADIVRRIISDIWIMGVISCKTRLGGNVSLLTLWQRDSYLIFALFHIRGAAFIFGIRTLPSRKVAPVLLWSCFTLRHSWMYI